MRNECRFFPPFFKWQRIVKFSEKSDVQKRNEKIPFNLSQLKKGIKFIETF